MNLLDIINEELDDDNTYVLEEGLFKVSPMIALFAFKDNVSNKLKGATEKVTSPISNVFGKVMTNTEKIKAKTVGQSGFKDDDTVYRFSKKQKEVMAYLYNKYGPDMVSKIEKFRKNVLAPYQVIKRNVAKNHSLTNKEIHGMTKEEYYKYRESGRKKIEAKGTFLKDAKDLRLSRNVSKETLQRAKKVYEDFKSGKIIDLSATNIEKILDEAGLGRQRLYGWSEGELEKTATRIKEIEGWLKDPSRMDDDGNVRVTYKRNDYRAHKENRQVLENTLKSLYEHGISYTNGKTDDDGRKNKGPFKEAFANYMLRREQIIKMRTAVPTAKFREYYEKILKDAVISADKVYKEKLDGFSSLEAKSQLNKMEKKIWGLKLTGVEHSGNINDWKLKIKPEDFMDNTKYYEKPEKVIKAERAMDKMLKQFERELKQDMSDEDVALCKKYRLFNNLLTVKQFKNADAMFKGEGELKKLKAMEHKEDMDIESEIFAAADKEYNSIKELEETQKKIKFKAEDENLSAEAKRRLDQFLSRIDPHNNSESTKLDRKKLFDIIEKVNAVEYTGVTDAKEDRADINNAEEQFEK